MAINKNHEFEDLNGVKCAIVERNANLARGQFLKAILELNNYTVVIALSPPPKAPPPPKPATSDIPAEPIAAEPTPFAPETYTIGVTDVTFNPTNAIFGRMLRTKEGHIVTLGYWRQEESLSHDEIPYFEK